MLGDSPPASLCDTAVFKEFAEHVFGIEVCMPAVAWWCMREGVSGVRVGMSARVSECD